MTTVNMLTTRRSRRWNILLGGFVALCVCAVSAATQTVTPSTDRDNPTPFVSNEIKGEGTNDKTEYFYSFTAGPGEVTLTFDVKADKAANLHGFDYEVFDARSRRVAGGFLDPVRGESKRKLEKFVVRGQQPQQFTLRLVVTEYVDTYRVRIEGANGATGGTAPTATQTPAPPAAQSGNRLCLPATGTLVLTLADGTEEQVDLSQVKSAALK
ncbi:MAG: hypothetical protein ACJ741_19900 [Pyrinomonadaceae bacterium]